MTIDDLAMAIQKDFNDVHDEIAEIKNTMATLATKDEVKSLKDEVLKAIESFRKSTEKAMEKMDARLSIYASRTDDVDVRLRIVEKRG